ncbi:ATP-dependent helicase, partial [Candidatus Roizmanbacteria bacterium]|nr:ATP-dependent helicase [Candidatus Roizmanbacteria bacterium]
MTTTVLSSLNEEQQQAVKHHEGPLLIIAGAGTGKTTVIVEKVKHLLAENLCKPQEILALTFTEKAATEMEERIDRAMPYGYFQMWVSTFHSFADRILRAEISHIGLSPEYKLLSTAESILFFQRNLFQFELSYFRPLGNPHKFIEHMLQHFSRLKDEDITPEQYLEWASTLQPSEELLEEEIDKYQELAHAYITYEKLKIENSYMEFADLIYYVLQLFRKRPSILQKYRTQFKYILVDEFQDTNIAQYILIKLLAPPELAPNLTVVGDDSQAIYKFRGASISNILTFMKDYEQAAQITLRLNYRSYQSILDLSYKLIQNNNPDTLEYTLKISKELTASRGDQKTTSFHWFSDGGKEAEYVAEEIIRLRKEKGYAFSDFALLLRANGHSTLFQTTFSRFGIPFRFLGPGVLFKQPEIKDLLAYLYLLNDLEDSPSFYRILTMSLFKLPGEDLNQLLSFTKKISQPLFHSCKIVCSFFEPEWFKEEYEIYRPYLPLISSETRETVKGIVKTVQEQLSRSPHTPPSQLIYTFLQESGLLTQILEYATTKEEKIALNILKFLNRLKTYELDHEDTNIRTIIEFIDMNLKMGESPASSDTDAAAYDAVNILTVHASKGLEFPVVFLGNLIKGRFPSIEKSEPLPIPQDLIKELLPEGDYHLQEERRLFYVAMTRAKDLLYLSAAATYTDGKREHKISPFVIEALGEKVVAQQQNIKKEEKTQISLFDLFKQPEEIIEKKASRIKSFSYSQLESFKTCPLRYKYQYILKIPSPASHSASFGDSIHMTLQQFYLDFNLDGTLGLDHALHIYERNWIPIGYSNTAHEKRSKEEGHTMLRKYFEQLHRPEISILGVEKIFKIKVHDDVYISGKIDRIDKKGLNEVEIIDYKTGKMPDENLG